MKKLIVALTVSLCAAAATPIALAELEGEGRVEWPSHWTVFAPFGPDDRLADAAQLRSVPDRLRTVDTALADAPERETEPVRVEVEPGKPHDLVGLFDGQSPRNVAFVFLEVESGEAQEVELGMGADWWMEVWLNGEPLFDTLGSSGNVEFPISMTNHTVQARLEEGVNILAVRFLTGSASSVLALGGPAEFAAAEERLAQEQRESLNVFPERFEDRLIFPVEVQATIMADRGLELPETDADLPAGELAGLQRMPERQMDGRRDTLNRRFDDPVAIKLSKYRYPWEDAHLDAIVWTTPPEEGGPLPGRLDVLLKDGTGRVLSRNGIEELSPSGWFFSVGFPDALRGSAASLEVVWMDGEREVGRAEAPFHVNPARGVAASGRVPLRILNEPGARVANAPMTVGVPFPRGAVADPETVRLVDEEGVEQPLQTRVSGRWSRFGSIKWLLCDFTVDLDGAPRAWSLEFGPHVRRAGFPQIAVAQADTGFPDVDAGRLRIEKGVLSFDLTGDGDFEPILTERALTGAFVRRENGERFLVPSDTRHHVEEIGSEKVLLRRTGWYVEPESGERFCQFVTRMAFHRSSPVARIHHSWIYTGDSNVDRIADMGWVFETAAPAEQGAFLSSFSEGEWIAAPSLVQFDYQRYLLSQGGEEFPGRTPGVASMSVGDARVSFGAKDFWQNFPSEIAFEEEGLAFYNWPRRNPPARFERPVPVNEAFRLRFAHEGETLDFRMPDEYAERDIWFSATRGVPAGTHYLEGRPETANAQGIARTEEMFLYFAPAAVSAGEAARVMQGLNDETLRAVVDPQWMTGTGVFGPIHPVDTERFAEEERLYELAAIAPARIVERMGTYGMWLYGDAPCWNISLPARRIDNYRAYNKLAYSANPYHSIPFARTGDPRFLKLAESAARQLSDASFCHYASADVDASVRPDFYRQQGWMGSMSMMPWATGRGPRNRGIVVDSDFLWDIYYLTGYGRARDVALLFGELTKHDSMSIPTTRHSQSSLKSYLDMYQGTFDPWFLDAAHEIAQQHVRAFGGEHEIDALTSTPARDMTGYDHWRAADQAFHRFTGCDEYLTVARNSAVSQANPRGVVIGAGAGRDGGGSWHAPYAWRLTGDPLFLRRAAATLDYLMYASYEGEPDYFLGVPSGSKADNPLRVARDVPLAMAALAEGGVEEMPDPVHNAVWFPPERPAMRFPRVRILHDGDGPLVLSLDARGGGVTRRSIHYRVTGPEGVVVDREDETSDVNVELDVPAGVYEVEIFGDLRLFLPLSYPDISEVVVFDPGEDMIATNAGAVGYWFMVPAGTRAFRVRYATPGGGRYPVHRATVWDPEGNRAWDRSFHNDDMSVEAVIAVPEGQDGKLWRATGANFEIDPTIPPYFSLSRSKWFNPEAQN